MHVRIKLKKFIKNCVSIKDLVINQNQSRYASSTSYVIKYKLIFMFCITRKMSVRIVYLLMIETPIEIHLSIDRYGKHDTFWDRRSHARMYCLNIWLLHERRLLSYSLKQTLHQKDLLILLVTVTAINRWILRHK